MAYACSNNGITVKWEPDGYSPQPGEVMLDPAVLGHEIGPADLRAHFPGYDAAVTALSAPDVLASKLEFGIAITSTGTPALDATYALDPVTLDEIGSVARDAAAGLGLPGGLSTFTYPDITGTPHTFAAADIQNLYKAMRNLLLQLNEQEATQAAGGTPTWPAQSATIA